MSDQPPVSFDPSLGKLYPSIAEVEFLLGGVGRLCFPDGTEQFAENDTYPEIVYSPRLELKALADFCEQNIDHYRAHKERYAVEIDEGEAPEIIRFWELE